MALSCTPKLVRNDIRRESRRLCCSEIGTFSASCELSIRAKGTGERLQVEAEDKRRVFGPSFSPQSRSLRFEALKRTRARRSNGKGQSEAVKQRRMKTAVVCTLYVSSFDMEDGSWIHGRVSLERGHSWGRPSCITGFRICLVFCAQALWRRCRIRSIGRPFLGNALIAAALRIHLRIPLMDGGLAA